MDKFRHIDSWVFDLDNTLYDAKTGVFDRIGERMNLYVADLLSLPLAEASAIRKGYWEAYGTTLYGLMQEHKIDPHHFLQHAHDIDISDVPVCETVKAGLARLPGRKVIFTNSSQDFARRMTRQLGLEGQFDDIFSIEDAAFLPKPRVEPYAALLKKSGIDPQKAVMFEDMEINLKTAHDLGMTTVWINPETTPDPPHVHHRTQTLAEWLKGRKHD